MSLLKSTSFVFAILIVVLTAKLNQSNKCKSLTDKFSEEQFCSAEKLDFWRTRFSPSMIKKSLGVTMSHRLSNHETSEPPSGRLACKYRYSFNSEGRLVDYEGNSFQFDAHRGDHAANQARYEEIGELIEKIVYEMLEKDCGLVRLPVTVDSSGDRERNPELQPDGDEGSFVFVSPDFEAKDKLLILIHGSGVVKAGQWARRLIINDCLDSGTQIPYIKKAHDNGYGVLVMNTNHNRYENGQRIPGSESPENHGYTVWEQLILCHKASSIALVAHSYGGVVTSSLLEQVPDDFKTRVKAIAFTDAIVHTRDEESRKYLKTVSCNWISSSQKLGTKLSGKKELLRVSAGTPKHEETSWSAFNKVFEFIFNKIP